MEAQRFTRGVLSWLCDYTCTRGNKDGRISPSLYHITIYRFNMGLWGTRGCGVWECGGGVIAPFGHVALLCRELATKLAGPAESAPNLLDSAVMASSVLGMRQLISVHGSAQSSFSGLNRSLQACGPSSPSQPRSRQPMSVEGGRAHPTATPCWLKSVACSASAAPGCACAEPAAASAPGSVAVMDL